MAARTVQVVVGPVAADVALAWVHHWQDLLAAVVAHPDGLSIDAPAMMVERLDAVLTQWASTAATSTTFWWRLVTSEDELRSIVDSWLVIGSLSDDDFEHLGKTWAPESTRPMADAVIAGASAALVLLGEHGADLRRQLGS